MINSLAKIADKGKSAWNIVKSVGPLLISQSDKASKALAIHKGRLASVQIGKEIILDEAKMLNQVRKQLLLKYTESDLSEKIRIKKDLESLESSLRQLTITHKALLYLPEGNEQTQTDRPTKQISPHWMDKFNELARARNEPWRKELLARALATEASNPGSVTPRALWLIGTLEEKLFNAFASLLDLSSNIGGNLMIPRVRSGIDKKPIPNCPFGNDIEIGNLIYMLEDIGVVADPLSTERTFAKHDEFTACYFSKRYLITCKEQNLNIRGIIPTGLGNAIARFYEQKYNKLGEEIFDEWIGSLNKEQFEVVEVPKVNIAKAPNKLPAKDSTTTDDP